MEEISRVILSQRRFFHSGKSYSLDFRRSSLLRLKRAILARTAEIENALLMDLNKSPIEGYMSEISVVLAEIDLVLSMLRGFMKKHYKPTPSVFFPAKSYTVFEPYGVVLILSPWNYPFQLALAPLVGAVAAGNCVILKPSSSSPATSTLIKSIIDEVFSCSQITSTTNSHVACITEVDYSLLLAERYDYIFFTGSARVGKVVMTAAAAHLTPVSLELGGKSPCIVEKTANISLAARRIIWGKMLNTGQTCVAPDYVVVHESLKKPLIKALVSEIKRQYGDPLTNPSYPKIVSMSHFKRLQGLLEGEAAIGGEQDPATCRIAPALLVNADWESKAMQEEIFGPLLPILTYSSIDKLLSILRSREKPLACYLFTQDAVLADKLVRRLPFGGGCINDTVIQLANHKLPFGGVGGSGMGCYHGSYSLQTFSHEKAVLKNYSLDIPFRYHPYSEGTQRLLRWLL